MSTYALAPSNCIIVKQIYSNSYVINLSWKNVSRSSLHLIIKRKIGVHRPAFDNPMILML